MNGTPPPAPDTPPAAGDQISPVAAFCVLVGLTFLILMAYVPSYASHLAVMLGIYLILIYSLNLVSGFGGLILFCHAAFYGIGAYTYAILRLGAGSPGARAEGLLWVGEWDFWPAVFAAGAGGSILAAAFGWVSLRFRGDRVIFATLGCQMVAFSLLYNWTELSGGSVGLYGVPRPACLGLQCSAPWHYAILVTLCLIIILTLLFRLYHSPFGRALLAMREDEIAARAMGINTTRLAHVAMVIAGGAAAVAGSLYAAYVTYVDPTSFSLHESIFLVLLLMLGGRGSLVGPFVGAVVAIGLPEFLRLVGLPAAVAANVRDLVYGAALAALMYWRPQGLAGAAENRS